MGKTESNIYLVVENLICPSYWLTVLLDAVRQRAAYRRQNIVRLSAEQLDGLPVSASPVLLCGATPEWIHDAVGALSGKGIHCILLNTEYPKGGDHVSVISLDQRSMSECAARYFFETGRKRPAFVAFNRRSVNDRAKLEFFSGSCRSFGIPFEEEDVFPFEGSLEGCAERFAEHCDPYDAVICANDISALLLLKNLKLQEKKRIPQDLYVIGFGNTMLSKMASPTLTSILMDFRQMGMTAVDNVIYLRRNPGICTQVTTLKARIVVGGSTDWKRAEDAGTASEAACLTRSEYTGFYRDPVTVEAFRMEKLLNSLDDLGLRMLLSVLRGDRKAEALEKLYVADSTYKYRLNKIYALAGVQNKEELALLLRRWIDADSLDEYLAQLSQTGKS